MANGVNAPFGLKPVRTITSSTFTGATNTYQIKSDTLESFYEGDPVALQTSQDQTAATAGYLKRWSNTDDPSVITSKIYPNIGVFQGVKYTDATGVPVFTNKWLAGTPILANTSIDAFVYDDPNIIYQVQVSNYTVFDGPTNQLLTLTRNRIGNYGTNVDPAAFENTPLYMAIGGANGNPATEGDISTGQSNAYLNLTQLGTNTPNFRSARYLCIGIANLPGNELGVLQGPSYTNPFNIAEVIMIDHAARVVPPYSTTMKFA